MITFSIVGKTPAENETLNISAILLRPTNLFESSEDIMFCFTSDVLIELRKK